jgi:hypothetical protein
VLDEAGRVGVLVEQGPGAFAGKRGLGHGAIPFSYCFLFGFPRQFLVNSLKTHSFHLTKRITSRQCSAKADGGAAAIPLPKPARIARSGVPHNLWELH